MKLQLNGDERDVPDGLTVAGLLEHLELDARLIVVERNLLILDRDLYGSTRLEAHDRLELVQFVGGG
jgi:sulfur carrier protein